MSLLCQSGQYLQAAAIVCAIAISGLQIRIQVRGVIEMSTSELIGKEILGPYGEAIITDIIGEYAEIEYKFSYNPAAQGGSAKRRYRNSYDNDRDSKILLSQIVFNDRYRNSDEMK